MILEKLKLLKSFGNSLDSTVTEADLAAKERELGVELPEALRELYLTFNPEDPMFQQTYRLLPLSELAVVEADVPVVEGAVCTILPFIEELKTGLYKGSRLYAIALCVPDAVLEKSGRREEEWPLSVEYNPRSKVISSLWKPPLSTMIMDCIGSAQAYALPNLVFVEAFPYTEYNRVYDGFSEILTEKSRTEWFPEKHILVSKLFQQPTGFPVNGTIFAARDKAVLRAWMEDKPARFEWLKQDGEVLIVPPKKFEPPRARDLYSITPILEFLRAFAGVTEPGLSQAELQKADDKLGPLPLPVQEYYTLFPKAYYKTHNTLRPLSSIRKTKSGILYFLEENQNCCQWGFSLDTPFLYCRVESKWEVNDYLDTFLAQEFAFELMSREELGLAFQHVQRVRPRAMELDGVLGRQLTEIAGLSHKLAWDFGVELFQTVDGKVVVLYNHGGNEMFLMSKDSGALEQLTNHL